MAVRAAPATAVAVNQPTVRVELGVRVAVGGLVSVGVRLGVEVRVCVRVGDAERVRVGGGGAGVDVAGRGERVAVDWREIGVVGSAEAGLADSIPLVSTARVRVGRTAAVGVARAVGRRCSSPGRERNLLWMKPT